MVNYIVFKNIEDVQKQHPQAYAFLCEEIRKSKSKERDEPFDKFEWCCHPGHIMEGSRGLPAQEVYRFTATKGKLRRVSPLYNAAGEVIPGLWSF